MSKKLEGKVKHVKQKVGENIYLYNVPVAYAAVARPVKKYQSNDTEFKATAFVAAEVREFLENEVLVNKTFAEVDVDRNKKRKIKYTSEDFPFAEGLHGVQLTKASKTKEGKPTKVTVVESVDGKGVPFEQDIGNGSVCTIKLWGYRNQDDLLNISLDTVVVVDHVPYEGGGGGVVSDDALGITYEVARADTSDTPDQDDVPFDTGEDQDEDY